MIRMLWDGAQSLVDSMVSDLLARISGIPPDWLLNDIAPEQGVGPAPAIDMSGPMRPPRAHYGDTRTNMVNIAPRPGESTDEMARRTADYLRQSGGAGSALQRLSDTPEDME